jgi:hypothetical protein
MDEEGREKRRGEEEGRRGGEKRRGEKERKEVGREGFWWFGSWVAI